MVNTNERSGHTDSERRPRADLRNPEVRRLVRDGKLSLVTAADNGTNLRTSDKDYQRREYAKIEALLHYFDDEWFDFAGMRAENRSKMVQSNDRKSVDSKLTPKRCTSCNREYHENGLRNGVESVEYLDKSVFGTIRMEKKECPTCQVEKKNAPLVDRQ